VEASRYQPLPHHYTPPNLIGSSSLPAAAASYALALGVARINERLPDPVYALLSGLNAATVGIIALAAVQLSQKAITDKLSRILVFFGATAGMLYNALWYFPVLMLVGGISTIVWDYRWLQNGVKRIRRRGRAGEGEGQDVEARESATELTETQPAGSLEQRTQTASSRQSRENTRALQNRQVATAQEERVSGMQDQDRERIVPEALRMKVFSWKSGIIIIACFFITFIVIMVLRGVLSNRPRGFSLFANLYLAGTIIFGGGPVVIPLLRE
jgi:chromate transport protein ChrA